MDDVRRVRQTGHGCSVERESRGGGKLQDGTSKYSCLGGDKRGWESRKSFRGRGGFKGETSAFGVSAKRGGSRSQRNKKFFKQQNELQILRKKKQRASYGTTEKKPAR